MNVPESTVEPSPDRSYVIIRAEGGYTSERALKDILRAHDLGRTLGTRRYLVDLTASRNVDTIVANYDLPRETVWQQPEVDKGARVVLLVAPDDHSHDFVETVGRNTGLNVTLFRDRARAEAFLVD